MIALQEVRRKCNIAEMKKIKLEGAKGGDKGWVSKNESMYIVKYAICNMQHVDTG